jgi:hypothetical protein
VEAERKKWEANPDRYTSPVLARSHLRRAGAGHFINGQWPPDAIPAEVWDVVDLYRLCVPIPDNDGFLPDAGSPLDQDAWTMDAFQVLRGAHSQIQSAQIKEWQATKGDG